MGEVRSLVVVVRGNRRRVAGADAAESAAVEFEMNGAPDWVQHAISLLIDKWGNNFADERRFASANVSQAAACHKVRDLAQRWGVPHP